MALSPVARAIAQVEGYFTSGTVAQRLNNPGNLIYVGQAGATPVPIKGADGKVRTFASWPTAEAGEAALERDLALKADRGFTLAQTIQAWLGFTTVKNAEGDPVLYTKLVADQLGVEPGTSLADLLGGGSGRLQASAAAIEDLFAEPDDHKQLIIYAGLGLAGAAILVALFAD